MKNSDLNIARLASRILYGLAVLFALGMLIWQFKGLRLKNIDVQAQTNVLNKVKPEQIFALAFEEGRQKSYVLLNLKTLSDNIRTFPWVRDVRVQRLWPDQLLVKVEEHLPLAHWREHGMTNAHALSFVNQQGEVFVSDPKHAASTDLRLHFSGPKNTSAQLTAWYRSLQQDFSALNWTIIQLGLSQHYTLNAFFKNGMQIEFGKEQQLWLRKAREFIAAYAQLKQVHGSKKIIYADLRYPKGFAVRVKQNDTEIPVRFIH